MPYNTETQAKETMQTFTLFIPFESNESDSFWVEYEDCYVEYSRSELQRNADELGVSFDYYFQEFLY